MTEHDIPQERDLPAGRFAQLKDDVMAQIDQDIDRETHAGAEPSVVRLAPRPRWRRIGLVAAAAAGALALSGVFALRGDDSVSAGPHRAMRNDDGEVVINVYEGQEPEKLEQRLRDLGVPAVVDFVESGYRCDRGRSDGWVEEPNSALWPHNHPDDPKWAPGQIILDPDALRSGETVVFEFYFDEFEGESASMTVMHTSMSPVGDCDPVEDPAVIVDAEKGIAGG